MGANMKLCIITPSFRGGGAEKIAVSLANYYSAIGIDVLLLSFSDEGPYKDAVYPGVESVTLGVSRGRHAFIKLSSLLRKEKPTHVLSVIRLSNIILGLVSFFNKNMKIVFREANTLSGMSELPLLKRIIMYRLMVLSYRRANLIIANSADTKADLINSVVSDPGKVIESVNPVLTSDYSDLVGQAVSHPWFDREDYKVILNVGRLHKQKNQEFLIKAFSKLFNKHRELRLLIMGEGEEKTKLMDLIHSLNLDSYVDIASFKKNPHPYYHKSHVFVLTSDWEGFGNVVVEALAAGTPVVSLNCPGGPKEILGYGRYGTLVPTGRLSELVCAIEDVIYGEKKYDSKVLKEYARKFTVERIGADYLSWMQRL